MAREYTAKEAFAEHNALKADKYYNENAKLNNEIAHLNEVVAELNEKLAETEKSNNDYIAKTSRTRHNKFDGYVVEILYGAKPFVLHLTGIWHRSR